MFIRVLPVIFCCFTRCKHWKQQSTQSFASKAMMAGPRCPRQEEEEEEEEEEKEEEEEEEEEATFLAT
jgi:ribosomal protein L12E/L44/L45/RPP1/RPP2